MALAYLSGQLESRNGVLANAPRGLARTGRVTSCVLSNELRKELCFVALRS
jgi:hypothetical protein